MGLFCISDGEAATPNAAGSVSVALVGKWFHSVYSMHGLCLVGPCCGCDLWVLCAEGFTMLVGMLLFQSHDTSCDGLDLQSA